MIGKDVFPLHQPAADELSQGDVVPPQLFRQQIPLPGIARKGEIHQPVDAGIQNVRETFHVMIGKFQTVHRGHVRHVDQPNLHPIIRQLLPRVVSAPEDFQAEFFQLLAGIKHADGDIGSGKPPGQLAGAVIQLRGHVQNPLPGVRANAAFSGKGAADGGGGNPRHFSDGINRGLFHETEGLLSEKMRRSFTGTGRPDPA